MLKSHFLTRDRSFYAQFFRMILFLALQNLIVYGVNLADNIMLGNYSEAALAGTAVLAASLMAGCGAKKEENKEQAQQEAEQAAAEAEKTAEETAEEMDRKGEEVAQQADQAQNEALADFIGPMDLAGSWEDEISQRAGMDVTQNEDGSYDIVVHWGGSATETALWQIHGTYDETSGMLTYEDGAYSIHTWDDKQNETISGEETTSGTFMKEGDKLRWSDSKNSDDGLFVKMD